MDQKLSSSDAANNEPSEWTRNGPNADFSSYLERYYQGVPIRFGTTLWMPPEVCGPAFGLTMPIGPHARFANYFRPSYTGMLPRAIPHWMNASKITPELYEKMIEPRFLNNSREERSNILKALLRVSSPSVVLNINRHTSLLLKKDPFRYLPNEISLRIIDFIQDPKTLALASRVSPLWRTLLNDEMTWKKQCRIHHFRHLSPDVQNRSVSPNNEIRPHYLDDYELFVTSMFSIRENIAEAALCPGVAQLKKATTYRSHFKTQYQLKEAWDSGGKLISKCVIRNSGIVSCLVMNEEFIAFTVGSAEIYIFTTQGNLCGTLCAHYDVIWSLAIWDNILVSGGVDRCLQVWDLKTGSCIHILAGHLLSVRCLKMDSKTIAISGSHDNSLMIWDVSDGIRLHVLSGHTSSVLCVDCQGDICVSGSFDSTAKVWRISTGELLHTLTGHSREIFSLAFQGDLIVTGSIDHSIHLWSAQTGTLQGILRGHKSLVWLLEIKDDILVSSDFAGKVRVWDLIGYKCLREIKAHDRRLSSLQCDEHKLVTSSLDGKVRIWDFRTGRLVREITGFRSIVWHMCFQEDKMVIVSTFNNHVTMELTSFAPTDRSETAVNNSRKRSIDPHFGDERDVTLAKARDYSRIMSGEQDTTYYALRVLLPIEDSSVVYTMAVPGLSADHVNDVLIVD